MAGALALEEKVLAIRAKTLPDDHPDLQRVRNNLASTRSALGDLPGALQLQEKVLAVRSATLPDEHPELQSARNNLANTKRKLGDLAGALALHEKVLSVRSKTLPDEHPELQKTRTNLASTKYMLGDLAGALALQEKVLAICSRTLPDEHPDLQAARANLALTKEALGGLADALELQKKVLAVRSKTLKDEHPDLQSARNNLGTTMRRLGDLTGALVLQEKVLSVYSKTLPEEHADVQLARCNLAVTKRNLGDLSGALALEEKALAIYSRTFPDEHPHLQAARHNLAATKFALGDLPSAFALQEKVLAVRANVLPDEHGDVLSARANLALTKRKLGDWTGALALQEQVLAAYSRNLPEDHPDRLAASTNLAATKREIGDLAGALALEQRIHAVLSETLPDWHPSLQCARNNLALTKRELGDLLGALALEEKVLTVYSRTLPDEHPDLQLARSNLASTKRKLGDLRGAAQLCHSGIAGALSRMSTALVSTRNAAHLALGAAPLLSEVGTLLATDPAMEGPPALPADLVMTLTSASLELHTMIRSAEGQAVAMLRNVVAEAPDNLASLRRALDKASNDLEDAIAFPPGGGEDATGKNVSQEDAIREAVLAQDAAERAIHDSVPPELRATPTAQVLAARLTPDEAAIAFLTYTRWTSDGEKPWIISSQRCFAAFVLTPDGNVTWHSLAPIADVETLIAAVRKDADAGIRIGTRSANATTDAQPGRDPEEATAEPDSLTPCLTALRDQLLAPVLAALPKDTKRLVISSADEMLLAPIEDLPLADGRTFSEAFDVRTVPSLRELVRKPQERAAEPRAFVVGGIDYDQAPAKHAPIVPEAATPILEPIASAPKPTDANQASTTRSGDQPTTRPFGALPGTATEAEQLETLFAATFPTNAPTVLRKVDASEAAFTEQAPGKTFLHLATHGYFAPEKYWKATDARDDSPLARFDVGRNDRTAQLSPFSLTGIALAGANLPPDELGRREGILTAQEITRLDLTACYLATLSACNTTLGVRRGGTGLASLRQAFHAAGARFVLATLWEVDDAEAQKLMADFYTRLWKNGEEPRSALRAAKRAARERGAAFRDWAGWLITGR